MKLNNFKRIVVEDYDSKDRNIAEKIGNSFNVYSEEVYRVLNKNVNIEDNMNMQYKDLTIEVNSAGVPKTTVQFKSDLNGKCQGITVEKVEMTSSPNFGTITSISNANPTVITTSSNHNMSTGYEILLSGTNSVPVINGIWKIVVLSANTFSIPVSVSSSGNAGTFTTGNYLFSAPFVEWSENQGLITINHCTGLKADKKYTIRVLAKA